MNKNEIWIKINSIALCVALVAGIFTSIVIFIHLGNFVGKIEANIDHLTKHTDDWDQSIITINNKISDIKHTAKVNLIEKQYE